ncbi:MAG: hypothetical protein RLZZ15_4093, partial [Verrucomicrobiota bacterium]
MKLPPFAALALLLLASAANPTRAASAPAPTAAPAEKIPVALPGVQRDGSVLLPNQWSLRPVGRQLPVGDFPVNIALHPDGTFAAVVHSGWGPHEVRILDVKTGRAISQVQLEETFYGLAWSPNGKQLFVSGAGTEVIFAFEFSDGYLAARRELRLRPQKEKGIPSGLAVAADGQALYVAESWGQRVEKISAADGALLWQRVFAPVQGTAEMMPEADRLKSGFAPEAPFPYTCLADDRHGRVFVSLWAKSAILVLDAKTGADLATWPVGEHPSEMLLASDGRLFVAEANFNSVSILDSATGRVVEKLTASLYPNAPPGSIPNSLALTADEKTLFVANANNNNLAVFDVATAGKATSLGFIPVGWYPTSVRVTRDGRRLVVANGKGNTSSPNSRGPFPGTPAPRDLQEHIAGLMRGTVSLIDLPPAAKRAEQFGAWSKTALQCSPLAADLAPTGTRPPGNPIPAKVGDPSPLKHAIYIIRENRTYDQIFGDVPAGNGAPALCLFPEKITPNAHALAREFVLLDNFYGDGEVSADGHEWTMGAIATDFVEKMWPMSYGRKIPDKHEYPSEGRYLVAAPANGYLWNRAAEAGVTFRSYGEFTLDGRGTKEKPAKPALPVLKGHIDELYPSWTNAITDQSRADRFIAELRRFEREGAMPRLQVVQLPNDHTVGTKTDALTPTAMVADNDLALGRIVEAVSRSKFWADTAIFVLEDDAQNGPDHVDAHRMPALAISPWTKRKSIDSSLYSTTSMLRTMELILGLQPMSQFDAAALPMWASFGDTADLTGFTARPVQVDTEQRNTKLSWGARESQKMDFTGPDKADDI